MFLLILKATLETLSNTEQNREKKNNQQQKNNSYLR